MNNKYNKNIEKQKAIQEKIEKLMLEQEILRKEQKEMEETEILKEYQSTEISIDEFLKMIRTYKKEMLKEKREQPEVYKKNKEDKNMDMEDIINGNRI
jgi:glutamic acid-rich protein